MTQTSDKTARALAALSHAKTHAKTDSDALFYTGVMALLEEKLDIAEAAFLDVLSLLPEHADARTNLGVIALKKEQPQQAITYFSEALGFDETHENARNNLAATFIHHRRFENACTHYNILLEQHPDNAEYRYNAGVAEMALGHLEPARKHFNTVLQQNPKHHAALTNLASIASRLNQTEDAVRLLTRAHDANPEDTSSQFMLDALTQKSAQRAPSLTYTKNLFDNYALYYEKHMTEGLNYAVPQKIAQVLHQLIPSLSIKKTLDLGCGTGLSGIILRELSTHLTGVDLSREMLEEAHKKAIYDELIEGDGLGFLKQNKTQFELIVAADVLPYFGELDNLFKAVKASLLPQGFFLFTHEITDKADWYLQTTARFAHNPRYIEVLAEQYALNIKHESTLIARKHHEKDLPVKLYALQST